MEPILLAGYPQGSSLGLVAAFEWLGQPYRIARVKMPDDMMSEGYIRLNGRQETPVLITADGVLTETMAIALWLESMDRERRISFQPGSWGAHRLHQHIAFLNTSFTGAFSPLWAAFEMEGGSGALLETLREHGRADVAKRHRQLEAMIGDSNYLLGSRPTLADAVFAGVARWAEFHSAIDPREYPKILALKQRLEADPAVKFAKAVENGESLPGSRAMTGLMSLEEAIREAQVRTQ